MGDYVQKKGLGQGFNMIYVSAICLGGNLNKKSFYFCNGNSQDYFHFGYIVFLSFIVTRFIGHFMPRNPQIMQERNTI